MCVWTIRAGRITTGRPTSGLFVRNEVGSSAAPSVARAALGTRHGRSPGLCLDNSPRRDHSRARPGCRACIHRWIQLVYGTVAAEVRSGCTHAHRGEGNRRSYARRRMENVGQFVRAACETRPPGISQRARTCYQTVDHSSSHHRHDNVHPCWHPGRRGGRHCHVA